MTVWRMPSSWRCERSKLPTSIRLDIFDRELRAYANSWHYYDQTSDRCNTEYFYVLFHHDILNRQSSHHDHHCSSETEMNHLGCVLILFLIDRQWPRMLLLCKVSLRWIRHKRHSGCWSYIDRNHSLLLEFVNPSLMTKKNSFNFINSERFKSIIDCETEDL